MILIIYVINMFKKYSCKSLLISQISLIHLSHTFHISIHPSHTFNIHHISIPFITYPFYSFIHNHCPYNACIMLCTKGFCIKKIIQIWKKKSILKVVIPTQQYIYICFWENRWLLYLLYIYRYIYNLHSPWAAEK